MKEYKVEKYETAFVQGLEIKLNCLAKKGCKIKQVIPVQADGIAQTFLIIYTVEK